MSWTREILLPTPSPPPRAWFMTVELTKLLLGITTKFSSWVSIFVESIPTETTDPILPSTSILSPTSNGWSSASMNEFTMFPRVCCIAKPMIRENTAKDARTPNNSIPSSDNARYRPPNQTAARNMKIMSELLPETVTLEGSENLSIITGTIIINDTLKIEDEMIMYVASKKGVIDFAKLSSDPRTQFIVN